MNQNFDTTPKLSSLKKGVVIRQANDIIEARYSFSLWEMRIFKTMLSRISAKDETFREEKLSIKELLLKYDKSFGGSLYDAVKEAATSVKSRFVYLPYLDERNMRRLKIMPLFSSIDIPMESIDGDNYIKLQFNELLKPYLIKLQSRYTSIDESILAEMDSAYTMRVYELVKENEFKKQGEFSFEEFREIIGAVEYNSKQEVVRDVLKTWQDVKRSILEPAQKHINAKTDITFDYNKILADTAGRGRKKVTGIRFFNIISKTPNRDIKDQPQLTEHTPEVLELLTLVGEFNITAHTLKSWLATFGKQQVYNGVAYSIEKQKTGKIKDMAAYIQKMVSTPDLVLQADILKQEKLNAQTKKKNEQISIDFEKEIEEKISKIKSDFYQQTKQLVVELVTSEKELHIQLIDLLRKEVVKTNNPLTLNALKSFTSMPALNPKEEFVKNLMAGSSFAGYMLNKFRQIRPNEYNELLTNYRKKIVAAGFDENIISWMNLLRKTKELKKY